MRRVSAYIVAVALVASASGPAILVAQERLPVAGGQVAEFGERLPLSTFDNLNAGVGGPARIDLVHVVGKKPVLLVSWIPKDTRSEQFLQDVQKLTDEIGPQKIVLYGVSRASFGATDTQPIRERIQALKIHVPVLNDSGFRLFKQLQEDPGPYLSILDADGRLRLANGVSLKQTLEYRMTLEDAIRRVADTGQLGTYGRLLKYYPATEMVGKKCPDFEAPEIGTGGTRRWSSMLASDRLNILIFWSVDCPHCRVSLPKINAWLKEHPDGLNVISAAMVPTDAAKTKTEEFCKTSGFVFPTLLDQRSEIKELYHIISTPTTLIIRPDGVVDSVLTSGDVNYGQTFEAKKKALLKRS
jgi:peroxiredoxin